MVKGSTKINGIDDKPMLLNVFFVVEILRTSIRIVNVLKVDIFEIMEYISI